MSDNSDLISKEVHTEREELHLRKGKKTYGTGSLKLFTSTSNEFMLPTSHVYTHTN